MAGIGSFIKAYDTLLKERPGTLASEQGGELAWLRRARERDALRWQKLGIPSRREERWKYTSLAPIEDATIALPLSAPALPPRSLFPIIEGVHAEIAFLNGRFIPEWSRIPAEDEAILVLSKTFEECVAHGWTKERMKKFAAFKAHVETSDADRETVFASMNTSFMQDAALILVPEGRAIERPILISYFSDPNVSASEIPMSSPRLFAHLEKGSKAAVIECFAGTEGRPYFTNAVSDLRVDDSASLSHCRVQAESDDAIHIATTRIHQRRSSSSETHQFSFGARLSRQDLHVSLEDQGAETLLGGLYMVSDKQHVDNYTLVDHLKPNTTSEQVYKGILDDESRAVFNGHVRIVRDAQKSNASQLNNNLVLSQKAEVDTRPELEIDADDVKAAHGATIGQIDPEHVFYLQARSIAKDEAVKMLSRGFAQDVSFKIRHPDVRRIIVEFVDERFESFSGGGARG